MAAAPLTLHQAVAILGVTERHLLRLDAEGTGPRRDGCGRYPASDLCEWIKKRYEGGDKARLTKAQADVAEMEAAELAGDVIRRAATIERWGKMTTAFRARMLVIPPTVAPRVAPAGHVADVQLELQKAIDEALTELSDG